MELGIDLRDLWREPGARVSRFPVTPRAVLWLAEQLPTSSAFMASRRGGLEFRPWPLDTLLTASVVNHLAAANHQRAGSKKRFKPPVIPPTQEAPSRVVRIADVKARKERLAQQESN